MVVSSACDGDAPPAIVFESDPRDLSAIFWFYQRGGNWWHVMLGFIVPIAAELLLQNVCHCSDVAATTAPAAPPTPPSTPAAPAARALRPSLSSSRASAPPARVLLAAVSGGGGEEVSCACGCAHLVEPNVLAAGWLDMLRKQMAVLPFVKLVRADHSNSSSSSSSSSSGGAASTSASEAAAASDNDTSAVSFIKRCDEPTARRKKNPLLHRSRERGDATRPPRSYLDACTAEVGL